MQKSLYLDACWIGEVMAIDTKEWSKEIKQKVILSTLIILSAFLFFYFI
jgi:hypothetical protein